MIGARRGREMLVALAAGVTFAFAPPAAGARAPGLAPPDLSVRAATLVVQATGQQLYGVRPNAELPIASTTKLMTALETLEHASTSEIFTYPAYELSPEDSQISLQPGERMSVGDLLLAMLLPSADDAAYGLAYNIGHGSVAKFIAMMNASARQLGLTHTHYSTPIGLDTPGNYSSPNDLVKLASYLLEHYPLFAHDVGLTRAVLHTGNYVRTVVNLNDLVARVPWIHGVKTGHTQDAGYCLVAVGTQNGMTLLSAVLGTASEAARDNNTLALLKWGFANFHLVKPVAASAVLARPTVSQQPGRHAEVIAARGFTDVVRRRLPVHVRLELPRQLRGPRRRYAVVGTAVILAGTSVIGRVPLLLAHALPAVSRLTLAVRFVTRPTTLLVLVVLLGGTALLVGRRHQQRQASRKPA